MQVRGLISKRLIAESEKDAKNQAVWRVSRPSLTASPAINLEALN